MKGKIYLVYTYTRGLYIPYTALAFVKEELKPCPLCGHSDIRMRQNDTKDVWYIFCNGCGCSTGGDVVRDMAIAAWNRRVK